MATPDPANVSPWYLRNINQALALDEASGNVYIRTNVEVANANITVGDVGITSFGNVDISGDALPITGNITIDPGQTIEVTQGTDPWIVSGNVIIDSLPEVEIKNDIDNPIPISKDTSVNSLTNPIYVSGVNNTSFFAPWQSDAFGRLRVSNPYTIFDTQSRYYDHGQFASSTSGTATVAYQADSSTYTCTVGTANGDSILRETVKTFPYQPGKSLLILSTFCMNEPKPNLRQRAGFFNASNGIFFEVNGSTVNMVIRSSSSGSIVEDRVAQVDWNGDTLLGTGGSSNLSGIELNTAVDQIWFCDVEWLGVGSVRVGFVINGVYIICHTFNHANIVGNTTTYMTTATLPLRYEITNTGITGSSSMLRQICASVISEGGFQLTGSGNPRAASHVIGTPVRLPNDASFKPVISIRLKSTTLDAVVIPTTYSLIPVAQSIFQFRVYKKAVTTGGSWVSSAADSSVEYNLAPTSLVSGDIAEESFINSSNQSSSAPSQVSFGFEYQLERQPFTGVAYEYVIMMATTGTNQDIYASIEWQEIT
jgi:hypothetical protein